MRRTLYRYLPWLHPRAIRERFADEMLWIFDETTGQKELRLFTDGAVSLLRQWTLHSGVWKVAAGAVASSLLVFGWWHGQESSLDQALRRGNPGALEEARRRSTIEHKALFDGVLGGIVHAASPHTAATGAQQGPRTSEPVDAVEGIVAAFKKHPVVMIGEDHWLRQAGDFYIRLTRDRKFQETVQDIVVEFASRNNQPLLDRYIAGEEVPIEDVQRIWRDSTKVASWESPIYAQWLAAIREANRGLQPSRRLRVLAGDTAIDWSHIHAHSDWSALGDNNISFADVIMEQVLKKKHRALVVLGTNHVLKSGDRDEGDNTTTRVESHHPGSTYVVLLLCEGSVASAARDLLRLTNLTAPELLELDETSEGKATDHVELSLLKKADALLYLGPPESLRLEPPQGGSLEPAYLKEVDRRSMIEWGELRARKFLGAAAR
jgi:hypothetical protein